jgi:hypothetical protein
MSPDSPTFDRIVGATDLVAAVAPFLTTEYASLTRAGHPITWPVTPYPGHDGHTVDVTTGLTYPLKAERARRDPRVGLCFSHPAGSGHERPPVVSIQGLATVHDADLVANSARYLALSRAKLPEVSARTPRWLLARMDWYWTRIWISITPVRALWWDDGDLSRPPRVWSAAEGTVAPPSDPAPSGTTSGSWRTRASDGDWRGATRGIVDRLGLPTITVVDPTGAPLALPCSSADHTENGFVVGLPNGVDAGDGPVSLTFHTHGATFDGQENVSLVGQGVVERPSDGLPRVHVRVDRMLSDWGVPRSRLGAAVSMAGAARRLRPRLRAEAARRGVGIPRWSAVEAFVPTAQP